MFFLKISFNENLEGFEQLNSNFNFKVVSQYIRNLHKSDFLQQTNRKWLCLRIVNVRGQGYRHKLSPDILDGISTCLSQCRWLIFNMQLKRESSLGMLGFDHHSSTV